MPHITKVNYADLAKLYVTEGISCRELGRRFGVSHSVVASHARAEDWEGQRIAYRASIARRGYENMAAAVASEHSEIAKESILVARAYIRKFAQDLANNRVAANAKDTIEFMRMLSSELSPEKGEGLKDGPRIVEGRALPAGDSDFLRRVVEMARERVAAPGILGTGPLVEPPESRPN